MHPDVAALDALLGSAPVEAEEAEDVAEREAEAEEWAAFDQFLEETGLLFELPLAEEEMVDEDPELLAELAEELGSGEVEAPAAKRARGEGSGSGARGQ